MKNDNPSRLHSEEGSKSLAHVIPSVKWGQASESPEATIGAPSLSKPPKATRVLKRPEPVSVPAKQSRRFNRTGHEEALVNSRAKTESFSLVDVPVMGEPASSARQKRKWEEDTSESTSKTASPPKDKKQRLLKRRARRRASQMVDQRFAGGTMNKLEASAVSASATKQYHAELVAFEQFAQPRGLDIKDPKVVDNLIVSYLNRVYLDGHQSYKADRLIAAVLHYYPQFGRMGGDKLPHAWRTIRGYRKLTPGQTRKAYPLALWAAFAAEMCRPGYLRMALFMLIELSSYVRPSELSGQGLLAGAASRWADQVLVPPFAPEEESIRTKTGDFDVSILLDSPWMQGWGDKLFDCLKHCGPQHASECPSISESLSPRINKTQRSQRSLHRLRSPVANAAGQWKTLKSVTRYEKSARLANTWEKLPQSFRTHALMCERDLGEILLKQKAPPQFSGTGVRGST